jgi:hypothetical protein
MLDTVLDFFVQFFNQDTSIILLSLFAILGYLFVVHGLLFVALYFLAEYKSDKLTDTWNWIYLAIDIPALNVQTPKAVEQIFATIYSVIDSPEIGTKFRSGYAQNTFSFEIISVGGYIQFIIRARDIFRDLAEAAIYAQYPEAEITEIEDYTSLVPDKYPNETHNLWAAEFGLVEDQAFPLRTYDEFVHSITKDDVLKDPMSAFLEALSRISAGEHMWFQMVLEPYPDKKWKEASIKKIKEVFSGEVKTKKNSTIVSDVTEHPRKFVGAALDQILNRESDYTSPETKSNDSPRQELTPGQTKLVEAMENKIRKLGYRTKIRALYAAKKEIFTPTRGVNALIGAISQFNIPSSNSLVPVMSTGASYFFAEKKKDEKRNKMIKAYKGRSVGKYKPAYVLNIEELATIWHFPMSSVKTPMIQKAEAKRAEPPSTLPIGMEIEMNDVSDVLESNSGSGEYNIENNDSGNNSIPVTDSGYIYDDDLEFG